MNADKPATRQQQTRKRLEPSHQQAKQRSFPFSGRLDWTDGVGLQPVIFDRLARLLENTAVDSLFDGTADNGVRANSSILAP